MKTTARTAIAAVAGTLALGTAGFALSSAHADGDRDPVLKRDDSTASWVVTADDTDDDDRDDDLSTTVTRGTRNTAPTKNTAPTRNTAKTVASAPTRNTAPTTGTDR